MKELMALQVEQGNKDNAIRETVAELVKTDSFIDSSAQVVKFVNLDSDTKVKVG